MAGQDAAPQVAVLPAPRGGRLKPVRMSWLLLVSPAEVEQECECAPWTRRMHARARPPSEAGSVRGCRCLWTRPRQCHCPQRHARHTSTPPPLCVRRLGALPSIRLAQLCHPCHLLYKGDHFCSGLAPAPRSCSLPARAHAWPQLLPAPRRQPPHASQPAPVPPPSTPPHSPRGCTYPNHRQTLSSWFSPVLATSYSFVLALKLLHTYLLLRHPATALRWRPHILWVERTVRTMVCVRAVAYGESYKAWMERTSKMHAARVLL